MAYAITLLCKDEKFALNSLRLYITGLEIVCCDATNNQVCLAHTCPLFASLTRVVAPVRRRIKNKGHHSVSFVFYGADYGARTRHLRLGKATLYQMS